MTSQARKHDRPNILVILTDQQRWDSVGCYGQKLHTTPVLDRVAQDGVLFRHAFSPQPLCTPARACIQTGRYASELGVFMLDVALPIDEPTIATRLSGAGYDVGYLGKWHLAATAPRYADPDNRPGQREPYECTVQPVPAERRGGYRDFWLASNHLESTSRAYGGYLFDGEGRRVDFPPDRFRADAMTDLAIEYLETRSPENPFLFFLSFLEPHWQNDRNRHDAPRNTEDAFSDFELPGDLVDLPRHASWLDDSLDEEYPRYLACVNNLDQNLGRIREALDRLGLAENTLIIFTSDHGCHFGKHNDGAKNSCHDSSIRVPLVIEGPGFRGGRNCNELTSLIDIAPTILRAAGLELPRTMQGRPLQEALDPDVTDWREHVFFQLSPDILGRGIRTARWKYAVKAPHCDGWDSPSSDLYVEDFLFDLDSDPHELTNLVSEPDFDLVRARLREKLIGSMVQAGEAIPSIQPVVDRHAVA